jgi:hypothetical protein
MAGEPCEVIDCTDPSTRDTPLCGRHLRRKRTYGTPGDWDPVPRYKAPGVHQDHVDRLQALPWPQLVNWCDMALDEHRLPHWAELSDDVFWRVFAKYFTTR